jgi:hypothetical protein
MNEEIAPSVEMEDVFDPPVDLTENTTVDPSTVEMRESNKHTSAPELTEEERQSILLSKGFQEFMGQASKFMEKAMVASEQFDFMRDYTVNPDSLKYGNTL